MPKPNERPRQAWVYAGTDAEAMAFIYAADLAMWDTRVVHAVYALHGLGGVGSTLYLTGTFRQRPDYPQLRDMYDWLDSRGWTVLQIDIDDIPTWKAALGSYRPL